MPTLFEVPGLHFEPSLLLHGQQYFEIYKPLPTNCCVLWDTKTIIKVRSGTYINGPAALSISSCTSKQYISPFVATAPINPCPHPCSTSTNCIIVLSLLGTHGSCHHWKRILLLLILYFICECTILCLLFTWPSHGKHKVWGTVPNPHRLLSFLHRKLIQNGMD